jgi:xanthine dehydrogenase iron-sulfur cluster and FAD-binding subunit A
VAATPVRATRPKPPARPALECRHGAGCSRALQAQFSPISDMRASGAYRRQLLASLVHALLELKAKATAPPPWNRLPWRFCHERPP